MKRFLVELKGDRYEWFEIALDSTFHTERSYHIIISWLVASAPKVEAQIQLLHRRCTQYGLKLLPFPEVAMSRNLLLNPFTVPLMIPISDRDGIEAILRQQRFVSDGIFMTEPSFLPCLDDTVELEFPKSRVGGVKPIAGVQYVDPDGLLFVRVLEDSNGCSILFGIVNNLLVCGNKCRFSEAQTISKNLLDAIRSPT
eukprot:CAMPEP_0116542456 /NCGR_PEP_ID=MMETSP0397-20121206/1026_1 /TAXON_ID=216820 /ORGANISM="Cyclophora tenuis, Strain ECT3854" /LENGTH=197 /DNA_ID=CAMNT_0004066467 /DNA_START=303 /DNA_END=896 /DNA_ORIENTATION=-